MTTDLEADLLRDRRPHPLPQLTAASQAVPDVVAGVMRRGGGASPDWDGRGLASALGPPHRGDYPLAALGPRCGDHPFDALGPH